MAKFRIETVLDPSNGLFKAEVYYPDNSAVPIVVSGAIYVSHEQAIADTVEIFKRSFPSQPITP